MMTFVVSTHLYRHFPKVVGYLRIKVYLAILQVRGNSDVNR